MSVLYGERELTALLIYSLTGLEETGPRVALYVTVHLSSFLDVFVKDCPSEITHLNPLGHEGLKGLAQLCRKRAGRFCSQGFGCAEHRGLLIQDLGCNRWVLKVARSSARSRGNSKLGRLEHAIEFL